MSEIKTAEQMLGLSGDYKLCEFAAINAHQSIAAMHQFARQQAVGFQNWINENEYYMGITGWWYDKHKEQFCKSSDDLYTLFINEQNKKG